MTEAVYSQDDKDSKMKIQYLHALAAAGNKTKLMTRVATDSKANLDDSIFQGQHSIDAFSKIST
jgi:hypothetical protein